MWAAPLLSDVIPPGGPPSCCLLCQHSWSPLQSYWTLITVLDIRSRTATTWMRDCDAAFSSLGVVRVIVLTVAPCLSPSDNDKSSIRPTACPPLSCSPESIPITDYERYCLSVLSLSGLRPPIRPHESCAVTWQPEYEEYLKRVSPHGLAPRPYIDSPPFDNAAYLLYCARVQQLTSTDSVWPFHSCCSIAAA